MNLLNTDIVSLIHAYSKILSYSNDVVFHSINKEFENAMTIEKLEILDYVNITSKVNIKYSVTNTSIYINNKQDRLIQEVDEKSKINPSYNDYRNAIDEILKQEKNADKLLSSLAKKEINIKADK